MVLVYDVTDQHSFDKLQSLMDQARERGASQATFCLCGNKYDDMNR